MATKITDSAVSTLKQSINEQFIEVLASNIFEQTNHISEQMEENDKFAYFQNKLENLNENLIGYSKMIDTFIAGNSELSQAVAEAKGSIPGLSDKVSDGAKSFGTARSSLDDTKTSLKSFSENVNQTMTSINDSMNKIQGSINATNLAGDAQQTADSLNQAALDAVELQRELNRLQEHLKKWSLKIACRMQTVPSFRKSLRRLNRSMAGQQILKKRSAALIRSQWDSPEIPRRIQSIHRYRAVWLRMQSTNRCRI